MKLFFLLFAAWLFLYGNLHADGPNRQPNILILYADDLGFGDLAIQNLNSKIPTPNLDQLARSGWRFTDGHSSSGICTPSRYAMLTGRYHWRAFHDIVGPFGKSKFTAEQLTLPEMLQQQGYNTACIGKWHLGWDWDAIKKPDAKQRKNKQGQPIGFGPEAFDWEQPIPDGPLAHGFDHYFGDTVINFPPYCWIKNDRVVQAPDSFMDTSKWKPIKEGNWECRPGPMANDWDPYAVLPTLTEKGVVYIKGQAESDKPFFLYFGFPCPHAPIIPNDQFNGKSNAGPYGDFVFETDDAVGQLLRALDESGQTENTIVIFSADNGPEIYAYERDKKFDHWSAEPFRGLKRDIYEGGHRVPLLIRWPGLLAPGKTSDALVSQIDFYATLADFLKVELPAGMAEDSQSFLPLLNGESKTARTILVHNTYPEHYAIRYEDWLLVDSKTGFVRPATADWNQRRKYHADHDDTVTVELFNLKDDIGQRNNLSRQYPDRVLELQTQLKEIRRKP